MFASSSSVAFGKRAAKGNLRGRVRMCALHRPEVSYEVFYLRDKELQVATRTQEGEADRIHSAKQIQAAH